jgi:hypothetical protein
VAGVRVSQSIHIEEYDDSISKVSPFHLVLCFYSCDLTLTSLFQSSMFIIITLDSFITIFKPDCLYDSIHCRAITTAFPSFMMRSDFEDDMNNL